MSLGITVIDNHSPDDVRGLVRHEFGDSVTLVVNEANLGATGNWVRCRELAQATSADYWLLLEDDNYLEQDYFEKAVSAAESGADVVFTACTEFDDSGARGHWRPWSVRGGFLPSGEVPRIECLAWAFTCPIKVSSMLVRNTRRLHGLPAFGEEFASWQDVAGICPLILEARRVVYIDQAVMGYYLNPRSLTAASQRDRRQAMAEALRALKANAERLVATDWFEDADWLLAAENAPIDRLILAALATALEPRGTTAHVASLLRRVLVSRSKEVRGWKGLGASLLGMPFWALAARRARTIGRLRRTDMTTMDFDSRSR